MSSEGSDESAHAQTQQSIRCSHTHTHNMDVDEGHAGQNLDPLAWLDTQALD